MNRLTYFINAGTLLAGLSLSCGHASRAQGTSGPVVSVAGGKIQGNLLSAGGAMFKGIPFAAPPVGGLRWREPQPVKPWAGVRQTTEYSPACMQAESGYSSTYASTSSEDCLYLNVWTADWPVKTKKPVMVWVHGGANGLGSASGSIGSATGEPPFDGEVLSRHGVVIVTIPYRLGLFGFIGHPELTAESPHHASGDYGLLDQIAALQWVHDNIARFGGDPANVTLFGQSAGAQDITLLVASPLTRGLANKAIVESGSPMVGDKRLTTPAQTEQLGMVLADVLKAPAQGAIPYLRGLPASTILAAAPDFRKKLTLPLILDVGTDGYTLPAFTPEVYREGKEAAIPMIIGSNGRDNPGGGRNAAALSDDEMRASVKKRLETIYSKYPDLAERAMKAYGVNASEALPVSYTPYGPLALQLASDLDFRCQAAIETGWHSRLAPTYEYEFDAGNEAHPPNHAAELGFVFGNLRDMASDKNFVKLSDQMQLYWTNFAKTGDPNGPGLPKWPRANVQTRSYLEMSNDGPLEKAALRSATCEIYKEKLTRDLDARKQ